MKKYIYVLLIFFLCSCERHIVIPALKNAYVTSVYPDINFCGNNEAVRGAGYGTKKSISDNYITYPALYLINTEDEKASFLIGGFDLTSVKDEIVHASLKFFINYASNDRKNVTVFVRPLLKDWSCDKITFNGVYSRTVDNEIALRDLAEKNDAFCKIIVFDIKKNDYRDNVIPFAGAYKTVSVNITDMVQKTVKEDKKLYGFLIEAMDLNDFRYITADKSGVVSDTGIIEIIPAEWFAWDGIIPGYFFLKNGKWINLKNRSKNKIKYIPRIEISVRKK